MRMKTLPLMRCLGLLCAALLLCHCQKAPSLTLTSPSDLVIEAGGGTATVTFTTNMDWTVRSDSWIHVTPSGGTASKQPVSVTVTVDPNTSSSDRSGRITLSAGDLSQTVAVRQEASYFRLMINLNTPVPDKHEVVFNADATGTNFIVQTDQRDWSISSDADWCKVEKTEGTVSMAATAVILVDDYDVRDENGYYHNLAARECNVRVRAGSIYDKTIHVVQQGRVYFNYTEDFAWNLDLFSYVLEMSAAGEEKDAYIVTNCYKWVPASDASWLTVSRKDQVTLHLVSQPAAAGEGPRSARVTITDSNDESQSTTFTVMDKQGQLSGTDYGYEDATVWDD